MYAALALHQAILSIICKRCCQCCCVYVVIFKCKRNLKTWSLDLVVYVSHTTVHSVIHFARWTHLFM